LVLFEQHELVAPPLDASVLARGLATRQRQIVDGIPPDGEGSMGVVDDELAITVAQTHARLARALGHGCLLGGERIARAAAPAELDDLDLAALSFHIEIVELSWRASLPGCPRR
jgi:hypothetical protein